ncbi:MAG: hypothetical protein AB7G23_16495 [Vicinamibacterales bacterium]
MRLAWFRPERATTVDGTAHLVPVIAALRSQVTIDLVPEREAHAFVTAHHVAPWDLCIFELDDAAAYDYVWAYLVHYPGLLVLHTPSVHRSRAAALDRQNRRADYAAERAFEALGVGSGPRAAGTVLADAVRTGAPQTGTGDANGLKADRPSQQPVRGLHPRLPLPQGRWPMLRVPITASLATVVTDPVWATELADTYPGATVDAVPIGVPGLPSPLGPPESAQVPAGHPPALPRPVLVSLPGAPPPSRHERDRSARVRDAVVAGARAAGREAIVVEAQADLPRTPDIVVALGWPDPVRLRPAMLSALAAACPLVVLEAGGVADWPTLDPHTWRLRAWTPGEPLAISLDPRDELQSLTHAVERLTRDGALGRQLGRAGHAWWRRHGTVACAADAWLAVLRRAAGARRVRTVDRPERPAGWPAHLSADGTATARRLLGGFSRTVDVLE